MAGVAPGGDSDTSDQAPRVPGEPIHGGFSGAHVLPIWSISVVFLPDILWWTVSTKLGRVAALLLLATISGAVLAVWSWNVPTVVALTGAVAGVVHAIRLESRESKPSAQKDSV